MTTSRFRVAIIGGGIGGLALALAISKGANDIDVDIYESAASFNDLGAGLVLWPRIVEILTQWGFEDDLKDRAAPPGVDLKMKYLKGDQTEPLEWGTSSNNVNGMHRGEFLKMFESRIAATRCNVVFQKKFIAYEEPADGPVTVHFADGTTAAGDILIGADGVRSTVRRVMYTRFEQQALKSGSSIEDAEKLRFYIPPKWSGETLYRCLVTKEDLQKASPSHISLRIPLYFTGKGKFLMTYPISQGRILNAAALIARHDLTGTSYEGPWSAEVSADEVVAHFGGWTEEAQIIAQQMKNVSRWAVNYTELLPTYLDGRVALIGDSAHAMVTHQASGAGQTVEDAFVLGTLLALPETNKSNLRTALEVYDTLRRPKAQDIQRKSLSTGKLIMMETMEDVSAEESAKGTVPLERLRKVQQEIKASYAWVRSSAKDDRAEAIKMFEDRVRGKA